MEENNEKLVTLKTFDSGFPAQLLKSKLEASGIDSVIFNENTVTLNPLISNAIGGILLKIRESDLEKANEVLLEISNSPLINEYEEVIRCPKCNSDKIESTSKAIKSKKSIFAYILALLTTTYPLHTDLVYRCMNCNSEFEK